MKLCVCVLCFQHSRNLCWDLSSSNSGEILCFAISLSNPAKYGGLCSLASVFLTRDPLNVWVLLTPKYRHFLFTSLFCSWVIYHKNMDFLGNILMKPDPLNILSQFLTTYKVARNKVENYSPISYLEGGVNYFKSM